MRLLTLRNVNRVLAAVIVVMVGIVGYRLFAPINPATLRSLRVETSQLAAGSTITYVSSGCRYVGNNVQTSVIRVLIATQQPALQPIALSADTVASTPGCRTSTRRVLVPTSVPAGCYKLRQTAIYYINALRSPVSRQIESNTFCIQADTATVQLNDVAKELSDLEQKVTALEAASGSSDAAVTAPSQKAATSTAQHTTASPGASANSVGPSPSASQPTPTPAPTPSPQPSSGLLPIVRDLVDGLLK